MLAGMELWGQLVWPLAWTRAVVSTRSGQPWLCTAKSGNFSLQLECGPPTLRPCCPQGYSCASWVTSESCWPPLPFPDHHSWQFPALQLYSWATATQAYVSPNQSAPVNLCYSFRAWILLFSCIMEFCAILWVSLWSQNWKPELRYSEIQRSSRRIACEWGTYAFTCHGLSFLLPAADRIRFEV